jgi:Fe-S oxidoreductase
MRKLNPETCLLCLLCLLAMPVGVRAETIFDSILGALRLKDVTTAAEAGAVAEEQRAQRILGVNVL